MFRKYLQYLVVACFPPLPTPPPKNVVVPEHIESLRLEKTFEAHLV